MPKDSKDKDTFEKGTIRELAQILVETGLSEIEIEREGLKIRVARQLQMNIAAPVQPLALAASSPAPAATTVAATSEAPAGPIDPTKHPGCVKSPMVGTAYRAPDPEAPPFVEVGSRVAQGQTVLIIEAMKTMNHVPAPRAGTVTRILVENKSPVEYDQPLMIIE